MKKGFSLVTLLVTIFVIITLTSTVVISANSIYNNNKKVKFASELSYIKELVSNYISNNNGKLPSSSGVLISTKSISKEDLSTQFAGESISEEDIIFLNKIDMSMINPGTLQYGNGSDEKSDDIYCISKKTGKIYYVRGCNIGGKIYYTLTDELKKSIKYTESNNVNDGIIFYDGNLDNGIKEIDIKIPDSYLDVELTSTDVSFEYSSENQSGYNIYKTKSKENSIISVKYKVNNDSEKKELKYSVESVDNSELTFSLSDIKVMKNSETKKDEKYITIENLSKKDNQIKIKKYANIYVNEEKAKNYFKNNGIEVKDNIVNIDNSLSGNITVYIEDKSGNYHIEYIRLGENNYVGNGLVLLLDGIKNTRNGHSTNTSIWEDLSGNNYDYTLNNIQINDNNIYFKGTNNSYALRKENLSEIFGNTLYDDRTIEIVVKDTSDSHIWICGNSSSRKAIGIYGERLTVSIPPDYVSTFSLKNSVLKVNNYSILHKKEGEICAYQNNEQLVNTNNLNCWTHSGEVSYIGNRSTNVTPLNGEIYSIRVYNRILTQEEINHNYMVDKARYGIK